MRQLKHKNITELREFIETSEYYFIILELVPGGELFHQIVRLTYFSEDLSRHVILQVAEAVRYLHEEAGVVHRDIKPENLLFYPTPIIPSKVKKLRPEDDENKEDEGEFIPGVGAGGIGTIKLADFGLSKVIWDSNTMTPCGTVGYTAPEIVNDQRYSKSVDMWALGCVLYTILCGFPPFYDESIQVLTEKVAKGQYTFLSPWWDSISKEAKHLIAQLLTVDPHRRLTINEFFQHPWITQGQKSVAPGAVAHGTTDTAAFALKPPREPESRNAETSRLAEAGSTPGNARNDKARTEKAFLSPAIAMKEAFDVFNAVHRMEEENNRMRMGQNVLSELDEEEEDGVPLERQMANARIAAGNPSAAAKRAPGRKQQVPPSAAFGAGGCGDKFFELNLDTSTLLERRKRAGVAAHPPVTST